MKKFLRFAVILLVIVAAAILILGAIEPTEVTVSRSTIIKGSKEAVFGQISHFHNWPNWSPWYRLDTTAKMTYYGAEGAVGSGYHWAGNDKVGEGDMKSTAINGTQMDFELKVIKPFESLATGTFKADDTAGMTRVTWSFKSKKKYPMNAMLVFMNMDKMLGKDFENGLNNMKMYVESHAEAPTGTAVQEVDFPAHTYAGIRKMVAWTDISKACGEAYGMLGKNLGPKITGPAAAIYYTWDTVKKNTDMAMVFPVADTTGIKDANIMHLPAAKACMAVHHGSYNNMEKTHESIRNYMAANHKNMTTCVEEMIVSPPAEKDSTKWVTNIYYLEQ